MRPRFIRRFWTREDGAALVEFSLLLPSLLVILALSVEGGRTFWSYQTTVTGVRDAARYLSRVVGPDVCQTGGSVSGWNAKLTDIVRNTEAGGSLFPSGVVVRGVRATLVCRTGNYRGARAGVATVTADLDITYPFAGLLAFAGITQGSVATQVADQTRVLGL